jgi:carbon-monoxide dehydrogenase iron sulfur subunit
LKIIAVDPNKCAGCRLCELACSLKNTGEYNPARARIHVSGFDEVFSLPVMCFQCEKPYCAEVCPAGAISKNATTGVVSIAREKCTGCRMCTLACPFGNVVFSSDDRAAVKCELCNGEPECVAFCPTGTLSYKEADTSLLYKQRNLSDKLKGVYEGTK